MRQFVLAAALLFASAAAAQPGPSLAERGQAAYRAGQFAESATLYTAALTAGDRDGSVAYNAACSFALAGQTDASFENLALAARLGFSDADLAASDADLTLLRADVRWPGALAAVRAVAARQARFWDGPALRTPFRADLTEDEKVAGLSRLWSEVKFNFANFDLVPHLDWDSLYVASLPLVRETASTRDYYRVLTGVVARLRDGHTNVYYPDTLAGEVYARPALRTRLVDGRVLVVALGDSLRAAGIAVGMELVAVDGEAVRAYAERTVRPYQSASTVQDLDVRTYEYGLLSGDVARPVALMLRDAAGRTAIWSVPRLTPAARRARLPSPPPFELAWLPGRVAHVRLNTFAGPEAADRFAAAFAEIGTASGLILDVRDNGGGNSAVGGNVLAMLTREPFRTSAWETRQYRPAFRAWGQPEATFGEPAGTWPADTRRHFAGPVAVLVGPRTFSAAEDFAVAFEAMQRGPVVGEPTGGSTGQPLSFALPGGGSARVVTKRDRHPDGREFVGVGVLPSVVARATAEDIRAGRDPVLDAAVRALRGE